MKRAMLLLGLFAFLSLAACDKDTAVKAANDVADQPATGVPILDMVKGALGLVLAVAGVRGAKAAYGAARYPNTPFTDEEFAEIEAGLVARGWVKPAPAPTTASGLPKA